MEATLACVERVLIGEEPIAAAGSGPADRLRGVEDVFEVVSIVTAAQAQSATASRRTRRVKSESCRAVTT